MHWLLQIWVEVCANPTQSQCIHTSRVLLENTANSLLRRQLMPSLRLDSRLCCCLVTQSCLTLLWPFCSPPGSSVYGILRQEYWSGLPFPSPRDLPDPGTEHTSPAWQADFYRWAAWEAPTPGFTEGHLSCFWFFYWKIIATLSMLVCSPFYTCAVTSLG